MGVRLLSVIIQLRTLPLASIRSLARTVDGSMDRLIEFKYCVFLVWTSVSILDMFPGTQGLEVFPVICSAAATVDNF